MSAVVNLALGVLVGVLFAPVFLLCLDVILDWIKERRRK